MVIRDKGNTPTAELLDALVKEHMVDAFAQEVEERGPPWHAICLLENELLELDQKHPDAGHLDGWRITVGHAPEGNEIPKYVGYGDAVAWLEHYDTIVTIEPGYGVILRDFTEFECSPMISVPFADNSGMILNKAMKHGILDGLEELWKL